MDPHELLTGDHDDLKKLAETLRALIDQDPKRLGEALIHFQISVQRHFKSEDVYYRLLDKDQRVPDRGLIHQLRNDHAAVLFTLESLSIRLRKNGVNPDWRTRFKNLMNVFLPHLEQEDRHLFPLGRKLLSPSELQTIAEQIQACE